VLGQIVRRIFTGAIVLWITTTLIYLGLGLAPGDELDARLGPEVAATLTPEDVQAMRAELGLDRALPIRYAIWLSKVVQGDLGYSSSEDMNATEALRQRVGATAMLVAVALFFGTIFGILIGIWAAVRENTWVDYILGSIPIFIAGIPGFILALFFIYTISVKLDLLPTSDMHDLGDESFLDLVEHMILPSSVLAIGLAAQLIRYTRASMLDVLNSEFMVAARSKGISNRRVIYRHAFRNALIPVISVVGMHLPEVIAGAVITETIFNWPGMGQLAVRAANYRDITMVMGIVLVVAVTVVISNLITDIAYTIADPRVRLG
jgi:peptide/nickel transport system permease protein